MAIAAIVTGAVLVLLGVGFYAGVPPHSITALIPAFLGVLIAILGVVARNEKARRHAMHGAMLFGVIGILGSLMGVSNWLKIVQGQQVARPHAALEQFLMLVVCGVFLTMCINSFVKARRAPAE